MDTLYLKKKACQWQISPMQFEHKLIPLWAITQTKHAVPGSHNKAYCTTNVYNVNVASHFNLNIDRRSLMKGI